MPRASTPTLQGFRVLMKEPAISRAWSASAGADWCQPNEMQLLPLPSWLHTPAQEFTAALVLHLAQYSPRPSFALEQITQSANPNYIPPRWERTTSVSVQGFSAGSYTGFWFTVSFMT